MDNAGVECFCDRKKSNLSENQAKIVRECIASASYHCQNSVLKDEINSVDEDES